MKITTAEINDDGINSVRQFGEYAQSTGMIEGLGIGQLYLNGVSVPSIPNLEAPFNIPIAGDNKTVSIGMDLLTAIDPEDPTKPVRLSRTKFALMLNNNPISVSIPPIVDYLGVKSDQITTSKTVDEAYRKFIKLGGFISVCVDILTVQGKASPLIDSKANFILFQDKDEAIKVTAQTRSIEFDLIRFVNSIEH